MKNIIITGTSRGIGFALVQQLAAEGHNILALSRHTASIKALNLPNVHCFPFDITKTESLQTVITYLQQWQCVDILIHNAGKLINKPFEQLTETDFLEV
ncbi:MAG: SDR family NAD(P)-dependent oxidoreductase, partial [Capnocytophaga ochracea]